eukprot:scaffold21773_cov51-Phaeocystis_antarctica.AAC.1
MSVAAMPPPLAMAPRPSPQWERAQWMTVRQWRRRRRRRGARRWRRRAAATARHTASLRTRAVAPAAPPWSPARLASPRRRTGAPSVGGARTSRPAVAESAPRFAPGDQLRETPAPPRSPESPFVPSRPHP